MLVCGALIHQQDRTLVVFVVVFRTYYTILTRAGARTLIGGGGVYIHVFRFCLTSFFCNKVDFKRN